MNLPKNYSTWYQDHFSELMGSGLWLRGGELNTLPSSEWNERPLKVLFTRLSTYFDTGYSFTHQLLYQLAANTPGVFPDLAYLPPKSDAIHFARDGVPWLVGTQSKFGPEAFDLIGFSNSIVQELLNLPHFLKNSGIPLSKKERMERADLPIILLGGANALYSSVVWGEDSLVDVVFVGESDAAIRRLLEIARDGKLEGLSKQEILTRMEEVPGVFQPENPRSTKKSFISNLNQSEALENGPVYYIEEQLGNSHLQISEGCPCFCSFCAESWDRKPYRERGAENLREIALRAKAAMGLDHIDIYSFNFNMHSGFYQVLWDLVPNFRGIGLKSQRFDLLARDPQMMEFQHAIEKASITCGLEGISPRLRKYLHKNLEDEDLHKSLSTIFKSKARELKVFTIATGLEEEQDFVALEDFLGHLKAIREACQATTRIIISMTPLVRFPWTPLEFEDAYSTEHYTAIIEKMARRVRMAGFEFRESADLPEYWVSQVLIRAADPKISRALLKTLADTGFVYYREVPASFMQTFSNALAAEGLEPAATLKGFSLEESLKKPWASIETGVKRQFLWDEVLRARLYKEIDYCLGRSWTQAKCFHCGGCPTRYHVRDIVLSSQKRNYTLEQFKERVRNARQGEVVLDFAMKLGPSGVGVPRKMLGVALARALMLSNAKTVPFYRGYRGSKMARDEKPCWIQGEDVISLCWQPDAVELLEELITDSQFIAQVNAHLGAWAQISGFAPKDWAVAHYEISTPAKFRPDRTLKDLGLKYTLKKLEERRYRYEFIPQSVKKGYLKSLEAWSVDAASNLDGGSRVLAVPGAKLDVVDFVRGSFIFSKDSEWVRTSVIASSKPL